MVERRFVIQRGATRVVFGSGAFARLAAEVEALRFERVVVVCTPRRQAEGEAIAAQLGARAAGVLPLAQEHVPEEIAAEAARATEAAAADAIVAFGGGSSIGLAKAVALRAARPVRVAAVPTTYSGSEMTPVWGTTVGGAKTTGRDERVRPVLVVYDPRLVAELPCEVAVPSAWNAMAHAVEALWSEDVDRATELAAEEALGLLASAVLALGGRLEDQPHARALEGAYLAGACFGDTGGGLHHKLCHALGGAFGLPHARTHAALLPHVVRFQRDRGASPNAMAAIARALGVVDPVLGLERLAQASGVARGLAELGMPESGIDRVAASVAPRLGLDVAELRALLASAWAPRSHGAASESATSLRAPESIVTQPGFGSTHDSEALEGALPRTQNAPRRCPYGLYPELLNGTPFTAHNAENSRVWMYRVRPSFSHTAFTELPAARFCAPLGEVEPNRTRWKALPIPAAPSAIDFVDGLVTLGGAGEPTAGPSWSVHLYAANADMRDRALADCDGDLLIVPQEGTLDCRTELGWLRVTPGSVLLVPRALKIAIGLPDGRARGWVLEACGRRLRLPERGLIGSNGLADARHFRAPTASYEDRTCPGGFQTVTKLGGRLWASTQEHSPFDVVAWHGNHAPFTYDLSLFAAMGSVRFDHPDPSILTVLTCPLDDHGRALADFVVFPPRWEVFEKSFRPPFMHRNAASEVNMVIATKTPEHGYDPGTTFLSPLLTPHGVSTATYDAVLGLPDDAPDAPARIPDDSLWAMFESALPFRTTRWARETPLVDARFTAMFEGMRTRFEPSRR